MLVFALGRLFADDKGRTPGWLRELTGGIFKACWSSYDGFFKRIFGDGERTVTDGDNDGDSNVKANPPLLRRGNDSSVDIANSNLEKIESAAHIV